MRYTFTFGAAAVAEGGDGVSRDTHDMSSTSHVTRHTSHVTRHTSHVTRHAHAPHLALPNSVCDLPLPVSPTDKSRELKPFNRRLTRDEAMLSLTCA